MFPTSFFRFFWGVWNRRCSLAPELISAPRYMPRPKRETAGRVLTLTRRRVAGDAVACSHAHSTPSAPTTLFVMCPPIGDDGSIASKTGPALHLQS